MGTAQHAEREWTPVAVPIGRETLQGDLALPPNATGLVLFAHGSGSSRHSPRNRSVARSLDGRRLGTLLIDLLTEAEERIDERTMALRFDIGLLARRLSEIIEWLRERPETASLPVGLFGASTGGGAALVVAAERPRDVAAVVSRGGRPDLAGAALARVAAPTLLIVGGRDEPVIRMNREALARMPGPVRIEVIPGATHLFEEPGALERVAELAGDWFVRFLGPAASRR